MIPGERIFQTPRTARAEALTWNCVGWVQGIARRPVWLEKKEERTE